MEECLNKKCIRHDDSFDSNCELIPNVPICPNKMLAETANPMPSAACACSIPKTCMWSAEDDEFWSWTTGCGESFVMNEGTLEDNKFKYCMYCGCKIEE